MKVIDNSRLRQEEEVEEKKKSPLKQMQDMWARQRQQEIDKFERTVTVECDWRLWGQLNKMIPSWMFLQLVMDQAESLLRDALKNRHNLDTVIVEPIHGDRNTKIELELDEQTIKDITKEAGKLGLSRDVYARAILYTMCFNENTRKEKIAAESKEMHKATEPYKVSEAYISQELKKKLEERYGMPTRIFGSITKSAYTNMLIKAASEHLGVEERTWGY